MSFKVDRRTFLSTVVAGGLATTVAGCIGDDDEEEFPSEPIDFETPNPPGGGSDAYVRSLSPALSDTYGVDVNPINATPGEQTIPELYNNGEDGYTIMHFNPTIHGWQIGEEGRDTPFNAANWHTLGAPANNFLIMVIGTHTGIETWDELVAAGEEGESFRGALIGPAMETYHDIVAGNSPVEIEKISGLEGTGDIMGGMEREEVDLYFAPDASLLSYTEDGICDPILTGDRDLIPEGLLEDYADIGHEGIAETTFSEAGLGELEDLLANPRAVLAPPDVPDDRVEVLEDGLWEAINSDEFADQAAENNLPVNPLDSDELQELLEAQADAWAERA